MADSDQGQSRAQDGMSLFDEMLADMIASGEHYLNEACAALGLSWRQVYRRLAKDVDFADLMNEAQEAGLEVRRARLDRIAAGDQTAGSSGDWKRDQLMIKQGNWTLEKLHPKRYGPKLEVETTNRNVQVPMSDDPNEAARAYADLMKG
jgi:hypothetical protein